MIRIRDLAERLNVSIGTISRALNDKADVNPLTRQRVREAAAELGYSPNQSGRSLRRGQTELVGIIVPTVGDRLIDNVFNAVLDALRRRLGEGNYDLAIFLQGRDEEVFGSLRRIAERGLVDGLVISNTLPDDPRIDYLVKKAKAFVAFGRSRSGGEHAWVDPDFESAVEKAIAELAGWGHDRIALLTSDSGVNYVQVTHEAYRHAMGRRYFAIDATWPRRMPPTEACGIAAFEAWRGADRPPTAALVADSRHAAGIYSALSKSGGVPGRDFSVIGILPEAHTFALKPALACVATDWSAVGARLGDALLLSIAANRSREGEATDAPLPIQEIVPVAYVPGGSVGPR